MLMAEHIQTVINLQHEYDSRNTPSMIERGKVIRERIPSDLKEMSDVLSKSAALPIGDLLIEGRDGTGRKSEVPWVRFASRKMSPSATSGWYVVFLWRRDGAGVYLALAHGSATFHGGSLVPRTDEELAELMSWGQEVLDEAVEPSERLRRRVSLASKASLALAYEKSTLAAYYYPSHKFSDGDGIRGDLASLARLLGIIYKAEREGKAPHTISPEEADTGLAIRLVVTPRKAIGQGYALTAAQRQAVELRAMKVASDHLSARGFAVRDVSAVESFDLLATSGGTELTVEVKGTTGRPGTVVLTANEVDLHRRAYPNNALIVVHDIQLAESDGLPVASGGHLIEFSPWSVDDSRLRPLAYNYTLAGEQGASF